MRDVFVTEYGEVSVSPDEAHTLSLAMTIRTIHSTGPLRESEAETLILAKADAIEADCKRRAMKNFRDFK